MSRRLLAPLLFFLLLLSACGDLENAGNVTQPDEPRPPEGAFGVSKTFSGPYLGSDGPITDPADERILEVEPGGKFFVRALYESPSGITDITVSLINPSPEGLAGPLDPTQSFFTIGAPTSVSEPGGGCELTGEDGAVTCIYEIQVAEDAVNIDELEGTGDEFAYVFQPQATNAAGATSEEDLRGYVVIAGGDGDDGDGDGGDEGDQDTLVPDPGLERRIRNILNKLDGELTKQDLEGLNIITYEGIGSPPQNQIGSLEGLQFATNLEVLDVPFNRVSDLSPLRNLTKLTKLNFIANDIADLSPLAENENLGEGARIRLGDNSRLELCPGEEDREDIDALIGRGASVSFNEPVDCETNEPPGDGEQEVCANPVAIPDEALQTVLRDELGLTENATITCEDLADLTELDYEADIPFTPSPSIDNLEGLQYAVNLESLRLYNNPLTPDEFSPIQDLTSLESLEISIIVDDDGAFFFLEDLVNIEKLSVSAFAQLNDEDLGPTIDLSPLQNLTKLAELTLRRLNPDDLEPLRDLKNLTSILISESGIRDLEPLQNLANLTSLEVFGSNIDTLEPLRNLTNLTNLTVRGSTLNDLSPLQNLTKLERLDFSGSKEISDLIPIQNLTSLVSIEFFANRISDISPIQNLTNLTVISFSSNEVSDLSPLQNLTELVVISLFSNEISDLGPLVANEGLAGRGNISLFDNPLDTCPGSEDREDIDTLTERGVLVNFTRSRDCG